MITAEDLLDGAVPLREWWPTAEDLLDGRARLPDEPSADQRGTSRAGRGASAGDPESWVSGFPTTDTLRAAPERTTLDRLWQAVRESRPVEALVGPTGEELLAGKGEYGSRIERQGLLPAMLSGDSDGAIAQAKESLQGRINSGTYNSLIDRIPDAVLSAVKGISPTMGYTLGALRDIVPNHGELERSITTGILNKGLETLVDTVDSPATALTVGAGLLGNEAVELGRLTPKLLSDIHRVVSGLFAADLTKGVVQNAPEVARVLQDPNASLREKTEAVVGELLPVAFAALAAHHAIKSPGIDPRGVPPPLDTAQGGWQPVGPLALAPEKPAGPRRVRIEFETAAGHPGTLEVNGPDVSEDSALAEIAAKHPGAITKRVESWPVATTDGASKIQVPEVRLPSVGTEFVEKTVESKTPTSVEGTEAQVPSSEAATKGIPEIFENTSKPAKPGGQGNQAAQVSPETRAMNKAKGDLRRKLGEEREKKVAQILGGRVSRELIFRAEHGTTDIDVVAPNGDIVSVGGPGKIFDIPNLQRELILYKLEAIARGVKAIAYFEKGTSETVIKAGEEILGADNVKTFLR